MSLIKSITILLFSVILVITSTNKSSCSEHNNYNKTFGIFIVPQYLFINGFRLDFEKKFTQNNDAIIFSPQLFTGRISELLQENFEDALKGAGLSLIYKHYLSSTVLEYNNSNQILDQSYFAGTAGYNFFNISYKDEELVEVGDEILPQIIEKNLNIHRINLGILFGIVFYTENGIALDFYVGSGVQFANQSSGEYSAGRNYNEGMINYGYEGVTFLIGAKIGAFLK